MNIEKLQKLSALDLTASSAQRVSTALEEVITMMQEISTLMLPHETQHSSSHYLIQPKILSATDDTSEEIAKVGLIDKRDEKTRAHLPVDEEGYFFSPKAIKK